MVDNVLLILVAYARLAVYLAAIGGVLWIAGLLWVACTPNWKVR